MKGSQAEAPSESRALLHQEQCSGSSTQPTPAPGRPPKFPHPSPTGRGKLSAQYPQETQETHHKAPETRGETGLHLQDLQCHRKRALPFTGFFFPHFWAIKCCFGQGEESGHYRKQAPRVKIVIEIKVFCHRVLWMEDLLLSLLGPCMP